jgi:hypothetical protein
MTFGLRQKPFGVSRQSAGRPAGVGKNVLAWLWVVTVLACSSSDGHGSAAMDAGTAPACDSTCLGTCVGDRCEIQIFSDADRMHPSPYFIAVNATDVFWTTTFSTPGFVMKAPLAEGRQHDGTVTPN